jgi:hypothetical protein
MTFFHQRFDLARESLCQIMISLRSDTDFH